MRKALLIIAVLLATVFAAEGRRPRISRMERAPLGIISDTIVYKVDSTGAQIIGLDSLPMMDTVATYALREQLDTLSRYFWSCIDTVTLADFDTLMAEYNDSIVNNLPGKREFRQIRKAMKKAYRDSVIENTPRILETFVLPDSLYYERNLRWTHDQGTNKIRLEKIDTSSNYHFIVIKESVVALPQQFGHCFTGSHRRHKPVGVLQIAEQSTIREWHWWLLCPQLQFRDYIICKTTANQVKPLLHIFLVDKAIIIGTEELIEVKLIEFSLGCYLAYAIWQLISEHHHLWQLCVWIMIALPFLLFCLLVTICPVVYLLLNKFTSRNGTERCSRKIKVRACAQRHQTFVVHFSGF